MAYTQNLQRQLSQSASSNSDSKILKVSLLASATVGLISAAAFYFYRSYGRGSSDALSAKDRRALLKRELLNELKKYPIEPAKD